MPIFSYTARDRDGRLVREKLAFPDEVAMRQHLRRNNLYLLEFAAGRSVGRGFGKGIKLNDLIILCRQLRTMIHAGMPLVSSLDAISEQSANPRLGEVMRGVAQGVNGGRTLASCMADYPRIFPEMLITLVRAGEEGGRLPETLQEAGRQMQLQLEIRNKLISAMMYPAFTLFITFLVLIVMLVVIVPAFKAIYDDFHASLPGPTLFLVWLSDVILHSAWIVILGTIAIVMTVRRYYSTEAGKIRIDGMKLKMPLAGALLLKSASAGLTGTLAGLLESGVPLINALQTASRTSGNEVIGIAVRRAAEQISVGRRLSDELEQTGLFPVMVVRMTSVAENSGNLPEVLRQISDSYVEEVEYTIRRIMTIIEPILILTVAAIVGFILVCLYYPIFNLGNAFLATG